MSVKQPKHIIVLKVLFYIALAHILIGILLLSILARKHVDIGLYFLFLGMLPIIPLAFFAFEPEFEKMRMKKERYIQQSTEDLQEDMASRNAGIHFRATKIRAGAFREGWIVEQCPHCGDRVSGDEQFCDKCGHALYVECKKCKSINVGDSKYCKKCGVKLIKE